MPSKLHSLRSRQLKKLAWLSLVWLLSSSAWADCRKLELTPLQSGAVGAQIGEVWSGTRVSYAVLDAGKDVYFGYYDASRQLTIAEYRRDDHQLCSVKLDSIFKGWDSHNYITLAVDAAGHIHVAGNMHASPLVYGRSKYPGSIDGMTLVPMIGKEEDRTTYPRFFTADNGDLLFLYRQGSSGDGTWVLNRQVGNEWRRLQSALFADRWSKGHVSAYPSQFIRGRDGTFHVAIVWRRTADVATNFAISYVKTKDFNSWFTHDGKTIPLPISPDTADTVEWPGEHAGLLNSLKVALDRADRPILIYSRYGENGHNAVVAARPSAAKWRVTTIATASRQTRLVGKGSLPNAPRFHAPILSLERDFADIDIGFSGELMRRYRLSLKTMHIQELPSRTATESMAAFKLPRSEGLAEARESIVRAKSTGKWDDKAPRSALYYLTQGTNRDQRRDCTPQAPKACAPPPSPLYYVEQTASPGNDSNESELTGQE